MREQQTLELFPQPSAILKRFILFTHVAALAVCVYLISHTLWALLLCPAILISLYITFNKHREPRVRRILHQTQGDWLWEFRDGKRVEGWHTGSTLRLPMLVVLHLKHHQSKQVERITLLSGSLPAEQHRRLRVVLNQAVN